MRVDGQQYSKTYVSLSLCRRYCATILVRVLLTHFDPRWSTPVSMRSQRINWHLCSIGSGHAAFCPVLQKSFPQHSLLDNVWWASNLMHISIFGRKRDLVNQPIVTATLNRPLTIRSTAASSCSSVVWALFIVFRQENVSTLVPMYNLFRVTFPHGRTTEQSWDIRATYPVRISSHPETEKIRLLNC